MHIFISYAKQDTYDLAMELDAQLDKLPDVTYWVDRELVPGHSWAREIEAEIDRCDLMVVLISPDVNRDPQGEKGLSFVINEIGHAQGEKKDIIAVLAQPTRVPIELRPYHYIDFTTNLKQGKKQLLAHIKKLVEQQVKKNDPPPPPVVKKREPKTQAKVQRPTQPQPQIIMPSKQQNPDAGSWRTLTANIDDWLQQQPRIARQCVYIVFIFILAFLVLIFTVIVLGLMGALITIGQ